MNGGLCLAALCLVAVAAAPARAAFDPGVEARNYAKVLEREAVYTTPGYQLELRTLGAQAGADALRAEAADPEREFVTDLCWNLNDGCAGDVRLWSWGPGHHGIVRPVLFTARNGATLSGHVWATKAGPRKRPGVVITNGSVQADEQLYWYAAQTLAKAGYVVLTFDPQGQGQSDTFGAGPDRGEGVPAQTDGRPFYDGTEDALDFFLSTPAHPYEPVKSCSTGTSHADKQRRRVAAGLDAPDNPFWRRIARGRIGLAGHSYGAAGVSYVGQADRRVKAVVAWDNLAPADPGQGIFGNDNPAEQPCPADPAARRPARLHTPALGMSADYFLPPTPNTAAPDPKAKAAESMAYSRAGVDSGEIVIRGGSHFDFSWIPDPAFGATLRGADEIAWYTTAWFDKYLKRNPKADARLLTDRWRHDRREAAVDPGHDGNMFSFYYRSRLDVHLAGGRPFDCERMRAGCHGRLRARDRWPGGYSYAAIATSPDRPRSTSLASRR